jgi:hypothetical protein
VAASSSWRSIRRCDRVSDGALRRSRTRYRQSEHSGPTAFSLRNDVAESPIERQNFHMLEPELIEYFWRNLEKRGPDDCWMWKGGSNKPGFGAIIWLGKVTSIGRISWMINKGDPGPLHVCHTCDVGFCANPNHLWLGTALQNMEDKMKKGRALGAVGIRNSKCKLTEADVLEIRHSPQRERILVERYGICKASISYIQARTTWPFLSSENFHEHPKELVAKTLCKGRGGGIKDPANGRFSKSARAKRHELAIPPLSISQTPP